MWLMRAIPGYLRAPLVIWLILASVARGGKEVEGALCFPEKSLDASSRAYIAPVVFEGKVRSVGDTSPRGVFRTVFDVQTVFKGNVAAGAQVKLDFVNADAVNSIGKTKRSRKHSILLRRCILAADIQQGKKYIVFASEIAGGNYSVVSAPLLQTKKTTRAVRNTVCKKCAKPPAAAGLRDVTQRTRGRLALKCRIRGNPIPSVTWFKDGKEVKPSKRIKIKTKRRKSTLRIQCLKEEDGGVYECRPSSIMGQGPSSKARVTITKSPRLPIRPGNVSSTLWPLIALPCPIESFCLNGGACKYYEAVGELVCQCAEGYKGQRCESKDLLGRRKCSGGRCQDVAAHSLFPPDDLHTALTSLGAVAPGRRSPGITQRMIDLPEWAALQAQYRWLDILQGELEDNNRCRD